MIYSNECSSNIFYKEILDNYDKEKQQKILEKLINIIITNENNNYFYSEEAIKEIEQEYNKNQGTFYNLSNIPSSNDTSSQNFNNLLQIFMIKKIQIIQIIIIIIIIFLMILILKLLFLIKITLMMFIIM